MDDAGLNRWRDGWRAAWPLLLVALVGGSRWVAADTWPASGSTLLSGAVACALCAVIAVARRRRDGRWVGGEALRWVCAGAALFGGPVLGYVLPGPASESVVRAAALCFVPLLVTVIVSVGAREAGGLRLGRELCAVVGALLLFPLSLPETAVAYVGLVLPPVLVAVGIVVLRRLGMGMPQTVSLLWGGALGLIGVEGLRHLLTPGPSVPVFWSAVALDAVTAGLTIFALMRLLRGETGRERFATVFLITPLLATLEGMLLLRPGLSLRFLCGVGLMAGAAALLWRREVAREDTMSLGTL